MKHAPCVSHAHVAQTGDIFSFATNYKLLPVGKLGGCTLKGAVVYCVCISQHATSQVGSVSAGACLHDIVLRVR